MKINKVLLSLTALGMALAAQANTITFTFLENGNGDLGPSSTFTEGGITLTATASPGEHLYAKNGGGDENGLGLAALDDHEIDADHFIQLTVPTVPGSSLKLLFLGSVQPGELANLYFSTTLGVLGSPILGGTVTSDGFFDISSLGPGYIGITGGGIAGGNVLLDAVTAEVPDCGMTFAMLAGTFTVLGIARRKLIAG